uniref:Major tail protein n=1 Tax=Desulfobacca acetoxidans TaxID=60893 RepID=A0A7V4G8I3_9BACT
MPLPHSIDNYTVPGGVKLFFDDGNGERDLGNITDLDLETGTEELEHFSNRSGKRLKDKVIVLEEKLTVKFKFDEPVIENLRYYFKGGDIENVNAGTWTVTNRPITLAGTALVSVGYYGISNVVLKDSQGNTMTQNADYIVDPGQAGADGRQVARIGRLASGGIEDGEVCTVSFTYTTWQHQRFPIAGSNFIEGSARLEVHPDAGRGLRFDVVVPKCLLKPNGAIGLDDKKWLEVPMMLEALDDSANTPKAPFGYYVSYENAA